MRNGEPLVIEIDCHEASCFVAVELYNQWFSMMIMLNMILSYAFLCSLQRSAKLKVEKI